MSRKLTGEKEPYQIEVLQTSNGRQCPNNLLKCPAPSFLWLKAHDQFRCYSQRPAEEIRDSPFPNPFPTAAQAGASFVVATVTQGGTFLAQSETVFEPQ
jgi:hypothetical protein